MSMRTLKVIVLACAISLGALPTQGALITDLHSTGVSKSEHIVLFNGTTDPNYVVVSSPRGAGNAYAINPQPFQFPSGWVPSDPPGSTGGSAWISGPRSPLDGFASNGTYQYRTLFTIASGFDPETAVIFGKVASADRVRIMLNDVQVFLGDGAASFDSFGVFDYFKSGTNTLDFFVQHVSVSGIGPQGLRVEMRGTAYVPEPASLWSIFVGMSVVIGFARHRARSSGLRK